MKNPLLSTKGDQYFQTEHLSADLKGRSVRGGVITMISQACKFSLGLASNIVLARLLTPQDYGLIGMVTAVTGFVSLFKDLGLSMATVQKEKITHEQVSTLFWINIALSLATMLVTAASAPMIASFYNEPRLFGITIALSAGFILNGLGIQHAALLNRQMYFTTLVTIDILSTAGSLIVAITAACYGAQYWALVWLPLSAAMISATGAWIACSWRPSLPKLHSGVRSMLVFGGNLTGFNVVNYFARNTDNVLIGRFWGAQQLGLYDKAYQLLLLPLQQINGPIAAVAVPTLSRLVDSPERYRIAYLRILEKLVMITTPLVVVMITTSDWLIGLLLGSHWADASQLFALLGIIAFTQPVANTTGWIFITQGRTRDMLHWGLIGSILSVIAIVAGLPWGATGVAASYAISGLLIRTPLLFWWVGRGSSIRTRDFYQVMAPSSFASLCALVGVLAIRYFIDIANPLIGLSLGFVTTVGITLVVLIMLPAGRNALKDFRALLPFIINSRKAKTQP